MEKQSNITGNLQGYADKEKGKGGINRIYKSRLFEMIFSSKRELLELYNAVNGTSYENPEELEVNTLENAIYMSMRNDLSFIIDSRLALYEHQSTYNPNLPLRFLMYTANLYSNMTKDRNLYGSRPVKLPAPGFVIFYNGLTEQPDRQIIKLSDVYEVQDREISLELKAVMLNINRGHNERLMSKCKTLKDYSIYVDKVREYTKSMPLEDAVEKAITECIEDDILAEFLRNNRTEAKNVSIFEYDEEKHMRQVKEEGREEGEAYTLERVNHLNRLLARQNRTEDIVRAASDREWQEKLFKEFGL
ncbi:hypothetical protein [Murimonas intestini]|uniref:hypothetical protein n=1 Tax=Murimonas intestini TaxID=1337051 RepID=UPI002ED595BF